MFHPVIPLSGIGGWNFLQSTYTRQLESYSNSPQIQNDRDYMLEKLSSPITLDDFIADKRLLRVTMTAFGLSGEEWKGGFIRKAIEEAGDPESTFLSRLNNTKYTNFANTFLPVDGEISLSQSDLAEIADKFETASFQIAVGEVDDTMRLALNYQSEISGLVGTNSTDSAILYRILGDVPVRTVLQTALNLPSDIQSLDLDQQAEIFKERLTSVLGISSMSELASQDAVDRIIQRYHAMESINNSGVDYSPASTALTLLSNGLGSQASQNLFISLL